MFLIEVGYPDEEEEISIARLTTGEDLPALAKLLDGQGVIEMQSLVRRIPVPDHVYSYAVRLVRQTRPDEGSAPDWLKPLVSWGAGPRAVQYMILGGKARAAMSGAFTVRIEDVQAVAAPVLRHRVLTTFAAESEGVRAGDVVERLVEESAQV